MARLGRVTVMVENEVSEKFHQIAVSFGLTDSALGAYVLGKYVHSVTGIKFPFTFGGDLDEESSPEEAD